VSTWLYRSSVPGMSVPGMAVPALDGAPGSTAGPFEYIGPWPLFYLDYLDVLTQETLSVVPGGSYTMVAVNSRAGLTVPPPDHRWLGAGGLFMLRAPADYRVMLAVGRAHTAALHARFAARPGTRQQEGGAMLSGVAAQALTTPPGPPSEAAVALAAGRAHNAARHALIARGEDPGGG